MCSRTSNADRLVIRSAWQMEFRYSVLRYMGVVRCSIVHRIDIEFMRNIGRSILGHNETTRVWCETYAAAHDAVRRISLVMRRMHITATAAHSRQRALQ